MSNVNNGIVYSSYGRNSRVYVKWTIAETDVINNEWEIDWEAGIVVEKNDYWYSNAVKINSIYIGGGDSLGSGTYSNIIGTGTYKKLSGTKRIKANEDGSKNIAVSISGWFYSYGNVQGNANFDLTPIPRKATLVTAPNFNDKSVPSITYSNPAGNAVTALEAAIYNDSGTQSYVPYRDISKTGSSYAFNLTDTERTNLTRAVQEGNSVPIRFYIRTTLGENTYLSYLDRTFTINDANPIVSGSVVDTNEKTIALTGDENKLVRYFSNAKATMAAEAQKGAALDESLYIIRNGNATGYGTEYTFNNVEDYMFVFSAEDTRGNVGSDTVYTSMVDYVIPTCNIKQFRPDALGNVRLICNGSVFIGNFGAEYNDFTVKYRYAVAGTAFKDNWTNMSVISQTCAYSADAEFQIEDFDVDKYYSFEIKIEDKLTSAVATESSFRAIPSFHWGENDFVFEVPVEFKSGTSGASIGNTVEGDLNVTGNLRLKGDGNYGNALLFGDGTYCYIIEPNDDELMIHAKKLHFDVSGGVYVDGYAIPILDKGVWTPALNSSVISSYTTQYGWYSKMGQSVTIGFYIKATCKSGYSSTAISISGMPFTPLYSAAGGGMCSGAYVSGGFNFQCFVADTSKSITTRVQSCNHTTQTNLSTSASGCWYPSGGGEITLSGTISFIANT